jgi:hypothetical protein
VQLIFRTKSSITLSNDGIANWFVSDMGIVGTAAAGTAVSDRQ